MVDSFKGNALPENTTEKIDSHQHFWQLSRGDYSWLTPDLFALYKNYKPDDYNKFRQQHNVTSTVLVQAAATTAETRFLLSLAKQYSWIGAVVGWIDFTAKDALNQLDTLLCHSQFSGLRPMLENIEDLDFILNPAFTEIFNQCSHNHISFDALVTPRHLNNLRTVLLRHPDLDAVIDHAGKPTAVNQHFDLWAHDIKLLADQTNTLCKISGLVVAAYATADSLEPYFHHLLECFGSSRLMWGSDWPVVNLTADYTTWVDITQRLVAALSATEKKDIWYNTAKNFYRL